MLDGQNLSGQLSDWSVRELLQIMQVTNKTGSLVIEGDRRGRIHFSDGAVTAADLTGKRQTYLAEDRNSIADVVYVLSSFEKGSFAMGPAEGPESGGWSVEEVLADVDDLSELESSVAESGLIEASGVRIIEDRTESIELSPEDWHVLASLVQPFTFTHLESRFGRGGAVRALHTIHRLGVAEAITSEDESSFLDTLAQGMTGDSNEPTWLEAQKGSEGDGDAEIPPVGEPAVAVGAADEVEDETATVDESQAEELETDDGGGEEETVRPRRQPVAVQGLAADASTTLTDGVYDEIRRLRSRAAEK